MRNSQQTSPVFYHYKDKELLHKIWCLCQIYDLVISIAIHAIIPNLKMLTV